MSTGKKWRLCVLYYCKHKVYCKCAVVSKHNSEQTVSKDTVQQQHRYLYKTHKKMLHQLQDFSLWNFTQGPGLLGFCCEEKKRSLVATKQQQQQSSVRKCVPLLLRTGTVVMPLFSSRHVSTGQIRYRTALGMFHLYANCSYPLV